MNRLQQLSFALCHVYAAATRSVSIPAPVYCEPRPPAEANSRLLTHVVILDADVRIIASLIYVSIDNLPRSGSAPALTSSSSLKWTTRTRATRPNSASRSGSKASASPSSSSKCTSFEETHARSRIFAYAEDQYAQESRTPSPKAVHLCMQFRVSGVRCIILRYAEVMMQLYMCVLEICTSDSVNARMNAQDRCCLEPVSVALKQMLQTATAAEQIVHVQSLMTRRRRGGMASPKQDGLESIMTQCGAERRRSVCAVTGGGRCEQRTAVEGLPANCIK